MHMILMADGVHATLANEGSRLLAAFSHFSQAAAPAAVAALWQGAAVAIALVLSLRLAPRVSAAHRFAVWAAGFAVVACLPFLPFLVQAAAPAAAAGSTGIDPAARSLLTLDSRWGLMIAAVWAAASLFRAAQLVFHALRLRRLWRSATPIENGALAASLNSAIGWRKPVAICTTRDLDRPSVIGFLAPRILIPEWLLDRLTPGELEQVVLHEAEHLRRRDDWTNLLQKFSLVLFPLNPALAWMERRLCREREIACDEGVVRRTQAPRAYAACLTSLAERRLARRAEALSLGAFGRRPELVRRVHSLLRRQRVLHPVAARTLISVMGCGLLLASVELARCPQTVEFVAAQKPHAQDLAPVRPQPDAAQIIRTADTQLGPAPNAAQSADGFRAIEAKAVLPANGNVDAPVAPASPRRAVRQDSIAKQEAALRASDAKQARQVLLNAGMPDASSDQASAQEPQYVVLTAYELVETSPHRARQFADYDTGAADPEQAGAANRAGAGKDGTDAHARVQVTVVHMVLAVYPAPATAGAASRPTQDSKSNSVRPATEEPAGGWLVFQL